MAEAYLRTRAKEGSLAIEVRSAGTMGMDGMPPADNTKKMLKEEKIDPAGYKSTKLDKNIIRWADMILVMESMHREKILSLDPASVEKVSYLGEFGANPEHFMIPDPIGRPPAFYRVSFNIIKQSIEGMIGWLKQ
ncbi:MAG: hypothetical protein KJ995_00300 [Candidatus Omnitrophica bacterium]|nr:hypothetical protein [Candidatus Omnitrophota bacterium]